MYESELGTTNELIIDQNTIKAGITKKSRIIIVKKI